MSGKRVAVVAKLSYARCSIISSAPTVCPLCRQAVAANELHECSHMEPTRLPTAKAAIRDKDRT